MFKLNETEAAAAKAFIEKHRDTDINRLGAIGGQFSYIFTPTSIGTCVSIRDQVSGAEENITDFGDW